MNKAPEDLSRPLFPDGFEGDDEHIDLGSYPPQNEAERQLFRHFDVRLKEGESLPDTHDVEAWPKVPGYHLMAVHQLEPTEDHAVKEVEGQLQQILAVMGRGTEKFYYRLTYVKDKAAESTNG